MTANCRFRFSEEEGWECPSKGLRVKWCRNDSAAMRLVEMTPSAKHPEWCELGHCGCVVEGVLDIEFENGTLRFEAGDAIVIPPGVSHRHRPKAASNRVRFVLVDLAV
jgi:quercetin dioxygenase-like cupin family protein